MKFYPLPFGFAVAYKKSSDGEWSVDGKVRRLFIKKQSEDGLTLITCIFFAYSFFLGWDGR